MAHIYLKMRTVQPQRSMITNFVVFALLVIDANDVWFQQYGTTCSTFHTTINLSRHTFDGRLINQNSDVNW